MWRPIQKEAIISVFADLCIEFAGAMLIAMTASIILGELGHLTKSIALFILSTYTAIQLRGNTND
jgi:hypothetical protein